MRSVKIILGIVSLMFVFAGMTIADEVTLGNVEQAKIELPKVDYKSQGSLVISEQEIMDEIVKLQ